jgi:hypothetical protein
MSLKQLVLFSGAMLALAAGATADAALFFADEFNYPNGDLTDIFQGPGMTLPGDNVSGGVWNDHSGTGFPETIKVLNGQAQLIIPGSEDANRSIADPILGAQAGGTWYYAALVTVNDLRTASPAPSIINDYFIHFKDSGNNFRGRVYAGNPSTGASGSGFRFGLSSTGGGQTDVWGTDLAFGTPYKIVASYNFDTGASSLWVNPASEASTSITSALPDAVGPGTFISALGLRQAFVSGAAPNTEFLIDAVALGDDFGDVLSAIPEPATAGLAIVGVMGLALVRRRR